LILPGWLTELISLLGLGTPFVYAAAAFGFFHYLDAQASEEVKKTIAVWMTRPPDFNKSQVSDALVQVFDRLYTHPLWGWRALMRSALFTTVIMAVSLYEFLPEYLPWLKGDFPNMSGRALNLYRIYLPAVLLSNIISDYISLYAVRFGLLRAGQNPFLGLLISSLLGMIIVVVLIKIRTVLLTSYMYPRLSIIEVIMTTDFNPSGIR